MTYVTGKTAEICFAGYFFGTFRFVRGNRKLLIVAIIIVSILPAIIEVWRAKRKA